VKSRNQVGHHYWEKRSGAIRQLSVARSSQQAEETTRTLSSVESRSIQEVAEKTRHSHRYCSALHRRLGNRWWTLSGANIQRLRQPFPETAKSRAIAESSPADFKSQQPRLTVNRF